MRYLFLIVASFLLLSTLNAQNKPSKTKLSAQPAGVELKTYVDSVAYAIGINIGNNLKRDELYFDLDKVKMGMNDALYSNVKLLDDEQVMAILQSFSTKLQAKYEQKQKEQAAANTKKAVEFLEKNKTNPNVKVTASGLQYEVLTEGNGPKPTANDKVKVHYSGTLIDGNKFDSSYDRGEPVTFPLNGVIKGWTEGLQLMSVGSKYRFYIPPELGYGENGAGGVIGPNEVLIFEVELLGIEQ